MDITTLITIIVVVVVVYFLIKFVVSPVIRAVIGIIFLLIIIYLLQRYLGFDLNRILSPLGINWILGPANYYIEQAKIIFRQIIK